MKLFVFRPNGFGIMTYFVMSETQETAAEAIKSFSRKDGINDFDWGSIESIHDGKAVYSIEIYEQDDVSENDNA